MLGCADELRRRPDSPGASVDGARHGARLARQMVAQIKRVQPEKGAPRNLANAALRHLGKDGVAELGKQ